MLLTTVDIGKRKKKKNCLQCCQGAVSTVNPPYLPSCVPPFPHKDSHSHIALASGNAQRPHHFPPSSSCTCAYHLADFACIALAGHPSFLKPLHPPSHGHLLCRFDTECARLAAACVDHGACLSLKLHKPSHAPPTCQLQGATNYCVRCRLPPSTLLLLAIVSMIFLNTVIEVWFVTRAKGLQIGMEPAIKAINIEFKVSAPKKLTHDPNKGCPILLGCSQDEKRHKLSHLPYWIQYPDPGCSRRGDRWIHHLKVHKSTRSATMNLIEHRTPV